jgi:TPR repeat protein
LANFSLRPIVIINAIMSATVSESPVKPESAAAPDEALAESFLQTARKAKAPTGPSPAPERGGFWSKLQDKLGLRPKSELELLHFRAEQGMPEDQHELGLRYLNGTGVPQDYRLAEMWFRRALNAQVPQAQTCLGDMFRLSQGVDKSYVEARKYYQLAADQNWGEAQFRLGQLYEFSQGVKEDFYEAAKWYQKAADQDVPGAQLFLGVLCFEGKGVKPDRAEAYKWLSLSANAGDTNAKACLEFVGPQLTREQLAEGESRIASYHKMREREEKNLLPKQGPESP